MMNQLLEAIIAFSQQTELTQMSVILTVVIIITGVLKYFKQPLIVGYLISGIVVGPFVLGLVEFGSEHSFIELFSEIGIALLLFMVGLGLNPKVIREHGKTALGVGMVQIIGSFLIGFLLDAMLGLDIITAAYVAAGLTFSSTIVIVKLLSDEDESESLYGKIAIGVLIVQDIVIMLLLMLISVIIQSGAGTENNMLLGGFILVVLVGFMAHYILPKLIRRLADVQEYLLLLGIGWCLLLGTLFWYFGFSFEIGCLLAGMSFAMSPYRIEMANKLKYLRDFFLVLFFIHVGMQLSFSNFWSYLLPIVVLSLFVLIGKPLLVYLTARFYGFTNKTALKAGLSLGQISEFSFLLIGIGITAGHITDPEILSVIMFVGLITICGSAYATINNGQIYTRWRNWFKDDLSTDELDENSLPAQIEVILFGYGSMGAQIAETLENHDVSYLVVDNNPNLIPLFAARELPYVFADATNFDAYKEVMQRGVRMVISTVNDYDDDREVIKVAKATDPEISVLVTSNKIEEALDLYDRGADYVIMPEHISAYHTGLLIEEIGFDLNKLLQKKQQHVASIREKVQYGIHSLFSI